MDNQWDIDGYDADTGKQLHEHHPTAKDNIWAAIEPKIPKSRKRLAVWTWMPVGVAAAVLLIIGLRMNHEPSPIETPIPTGNSIVQQPAIPTSTDTLIAGTEEQTETTTAPTAKNPTTIRTSNAHAVAPEVYAQESNERVPPVGDVEQTYRSIEPAIKPKQKDTASYIAQQDTKSNKKRSLHINDIPGMDAPPKNNPSAITKFIDEVQEPNKRNFASQFTLRKQH